MISELPLPDLPLSPDKRWRLAVHLEYGTVGLPLRKTETNASGSCTASCAPVRYADFCTAGSMEGDNVMYLASSWHLRGRPIIDVVRGT
jgi:hypothetical protein